MKKKCIVFVLSDFMAEDYQHTLRLSGKRHDLTGIRVYDPMEAEIPNLGLVRMRDAETGQIRLVNTQSGKLRRGYTQRYRDRKAYFQESFTRAGCGTLDCRVDESYVRKLLGYFKKRA